MQEANKQPGAFVTTQWTRVLQARGETAEASVALGELCEAYYQPVLTFIRWSVRKDELARDLTQDFFARLLARNHLGNVDPQRGKFRSYLLAAVKNFLKDAHARENAAKRNPGAPLLSLDPDTTATTAEQQIADPNIIAPEREFDRKWALAILDRALNSLDAEEKKAGKAQEFHVLKPWLVGDASTRGDAARLLNVSEGAIRVTVHRLRQRFRARVKEEIAATLHDPTPALIAEEMQYLVSILT
jgi:RNA polymerase sigma factor (sigma-70 family)